MILSYTHILTRTLIITILISISGIVHADGLAMHGQPQYDATDSHLAYVNPNAPKGGALKFAEIGTFDTLNPYTIKGQAPPNMNLVYDRLMRRVWDEPFTMYPLIAERVDIPDDRSSITFHINPNARFHDGSPITTADVIFSYETLKEHGRANMQRIYKLVSHAEAIDSHIITFSLGEGYDRETVMILAMMPILSKAWWHDKDFKTTILEPPLANGPYRIKSFDTGRKITYERVNDYWAKDLFVNRGQYNFDTVTYDYFRDDTIALEALKKGTLNLRRERSIDKWQESYNDMNPHIIKKRFPHSRPERANGFIFNLRKPPFDNYDVRRALSLAFDDTWVGDNIFHGKLKRINSFFPNSKLSGQHPLSAFSNAALIKWEKDIRPSVILPQNNTQHTTKTYRQNLREAARLLEKNGWIVKNGERVQKNTDTPFEFEIILTTPQQEKIALSYQRNLERLGITMHIRMMDSTTFQARKNIYDYDMMAFFWQNSLSPGTEQTLYWSCDAAKEASRFNFSGICNPALDYFSNAIANATLYDDLINYARIIDRILISEHIAIPLFFHGADYIAYDKKITPAPVTPIYGAVIESWWMEQENKQEQ